MTRYIKALDKKPVLEGPQNQFSLDVEAAWCAGGQTVKLPPTKVHSKSKQRWQRCKAGWVSSYDSIVEKRY